MEFSTIARVTNPATAVVLVLPGPQAATSMPLSVINWKMPDLSKPRTASTLVGFPSLSVSAGRNWEPKPTTPKRKPWPPRHHCASGSSPSKASPCVTLLIRLPDTRSTSLSEAPPNDFRRTLGLNHLAALPHRYSVQKKRHAGTTQIPVVSPTANPPHGTPSPRHSERGRRNATAPQHPGRHPPAIHRSTVRAPPCRRNQG